MKAFFQYCLVGQVVATAFIFGEQVARHPKLTDIVNNHQTKRVALNIEIGTENDASRLAIKDMVFDLNDQRHPLHDGTADNNISTKVVEMPSQDGIHTDCSGGSHSLTIVKEGQFINDRGVQNVNVKKGAWELVWLKNNHAGSLNIGFHIPQDYTRNDRTLPKGNMYVSFLVWSKESLRGARKAKEAAIQFAKEKLEERKQEITKMNETPNPFMKALHYRNAYVATETFHLDTHLKYYQETVPDEDETIDLQDDLILGVKGSIRTMEKPGGPHSTLGTCKLTLMPHHP